MGLGATGAPATVRKIVNVLSGALRFAVEDGRLPSNPAQRLKLPKPTKSRKRYLSHDQVAALAQAIDHAKDGREYGYGLVVLVLAYCGLRWGELSGLRIGWIACRDLEVLQRLERAKHYASICNSGPSEVLALIALRAREQLLERNRAIIAGNLPVFDAFFTRFPRLFEWQPPQGGCVAFPRYLGADGVEAMCSDLVRE